MNVIEKMFSIKFLVFVTSVRNQFSKALSCFGAQKQFLIARLHVLFAPIPEIKQFHSFETHVTASGNFEEAEKQILTGASFVKLNSESNGCQVPETHHAIPKTLNANYFHYFAVHVFLFSSH